MPENKTVLLADDAFARVLAVILVRRHQQHRDFTIIIRVFTPLGVFTAAAPPSKVEKQFRAGVTKQTCVLASTSEALIFLLSPSRRLRSTFGFCHVTNFHSHGELRRLGDSVFCCTTHNGGTWEWATTAREREAASARRRVRSSASDGCPRGGGGGTGRERGRKA